MDIGSLQQIILNDMPPFAFNDTSSLVQAQLAQQRPTLAPVREHSASRRSKINPRPSTAPDTEVKLGILPSLQTLPTSAQAHLAPPSPSLGSVSDGAEPMQLHRVAGDAGSIEGPVQGLRCVPSPYDFSSPVNVDTGSSREAAARPDLGDLPSPFEASSREDLVVNNDMPADVHAANTQSDYDWATFISAYASGLWDPRRTPNPPVSYVGPPVHYAYRIPESAAPLTTLVSAQSPDIDSPLAPSKTSRPAESLGVSRLSDLHAVPSTETCPTSKTGPSPQSEEQVTEVCISPVVQTASIPGTMSIKLPPPSSRFRNSLSDLRSSSIGPFSPDEIRPIPSPSSPDVTTAVATMRWAASRVNLSPLALPSPEHELTDPMRGMMTIIPGAHPQDPEPGMELMTPGGTVRRTRLPSFWKGTQDIDENSGYSRTRLATIDASPVTTPDEDQGSRHTVLQPASAPVAHSSEVAEGDYFTRQDRGNTLQVREEPPFGRRSTLPSVDAGLVTVPALPRRIILTRQSSSPLPGPSNLEHFSSRRPSTENAIFLKASRSAKEEQMYEHLGYLAPPYPPNELERRRALYKFNIWNTGPDISFDRIAHLAKLVFSTKGVYISLIDGHEQWFKSEWGMGKNSNIPRVQSFCGHTILQTGDEPMVILDTLHDWRFAKNPLVENSPNIRFYAGAPLRTQDGYNVGSLAVIDDQPRRDFTPRQRHTLKEFAAIVMREMELWRDKIQLRIRDRIQSSMEQFSRECLEIDTNAESQTANDIGAGLIGSSMDEVYDRAAKLVKRTLDVENVVVMDISHCEVLETVSSEGMVSVVMYTGDPDEGMTTRSLTSEEYVKLNSFFGQYPDGKISEGIVPPSFRPFLPTRIQYALIVPIFNIDKRPFALLCAYNASPHTKRFLEGHELSYLRAIGVIILSAVLKRRMLLADKAKSLFISNISHELRTPLHGILASAELLAGTDLNHSQHSFIQTVQACGKSLVETVNHVLDFTKLSGNSRSGGVDNIILPSKVDLLQLVEEAVDGCWIGHRARTSTLKDSDIGSVYAPVTQANSVTAPSKCSVETIVDIGQRDQSWNVICEKGGLRRVLMNVFGNSLKFTSSGYIHVALREIQPSEDIPLNKIKVELCVRDTGKGISRDFLRNRLFHPFSQENPLQTGTGLGLAIVNSIVHSESINGQLDVWSEEGVGTEIKVHFLAEVPEDVPPTTSCSRPNKLGDSSTWPSVSMVGFDLSDSGMQLFYSTLSTYITSWWGLVIKPPQMGLGDIIISNEDHSVVTTAYEQKDISRAIIILSSARGNPELMAIANDYERLGGFCRALYKPGGPSRLLTILKLAIQFCRIAQRSAVLSPSLSQGPLSPRSEEMDCYCGGRSQEDSWRGAGSVPRQNSDLHDGYRRGSRRPSMAPRAATFHPVLTPISLESPPGEPAEGDSAASQEGLGEQGLISTITVGNGGTLLKSSIGTIETREQAHVRVLIVEDNVILRDLLAKWLTTKGIDYRDAVDGRDGVSVYESEGPFDVVLLDLSMPVLDGIGATTEIRQIESTWAVQPSEGKPSIKASARILALTGMSSLEDKRRAFEAGVDGYLVKPVAFKTLEQMFRKLGIS